MKRISPGQSPIAAGLDSPVRVAWLDMLREGLTVFEQVVMVTQIRLQGSAPQACGARIVVTPASHSGTIGGGQLEHRACQQAREWLSDPAGPQRHCDSVGLGSRLGQCCGGRVSLLYERFSRADLAWLDDVQAGLADGLIYARLALSEPGSRREAVSEAVVPAMPEDAQLVVAQDVLYERLVDLRTPLLLFGAGHVGQALAPRLSGLPFKLRWLDSREQLSPVPPAGPGIAPVELGADPLYEVNRASPGSFYLILTHSHAEDFDILQAVLSRADAGWVGLIGSATKWRGFSHRLQVRGFSAADIAAVQCPIGLPGIPGKQPQIIAASVVAQLLICRAAAADCSPVKSGHDLSARGASHQQESHIDV
ncbi:xanthine dehydrogenase accessory protein XdhC [Granulosicoccaceae sp. 1_MG-2023]|nr:xanthine dehydrogenase accessory protein XdhC [Granulosicoccaceae sp. 1_MG-2023]